MGNLHKNTWLSDADIPQCFRKLGGSSLENLRGRIFINDSAFLNTLGCLRGKSAFKAFLANFVPMEEA